jgi:hemolysin activation/secretion protein
VPFKVFLSPGAAALLALCCFVTLSSPAHPVYAQQEPAGIEAPQGNPAALEPGAHPPAEPDPSFEINEFKVRGNTLFTTEKLTDLLDGLTGPGRTAADVEKARDTLEKFYHDAGYPTVLVNIPEQSAEGGEIRLQVVESRIGAARVTGNRYFSTRQILDKLPSLAPGAILYAPAVQLEVGKLNRNPDLKVVPSMAPGKEAGTVDVDLKAEDLRPFHGSLELSNRYSANTTPLRLNGAIHYDNLWHREHALSVQYQLSPQKPSEVEVFSGSYMLPAPWNADQSLVVYGVRSDSDSAFGEGFHTVGKGSIIGARLIVPLPGLGSYSQSAVLGIDYKNFTELTGAAGSPTGAATLPTGTQSSSTGDASKPVEYLPLSFAYSGSLPDSQGFTQFNAGLNLSFRGAVANQQDFADKRFRAAANYFTATAGLERRQQLPAGAGFLLKLDGQMADQPLITNEEFSAGGMESVRGYLESSALGDSGFHATAELSAMDLGPRLGLGARSQVVPYLFYDCAALWVKYPLPSQDGSLELQGTGLGVRGFFFKDLEYQFDWAFALAKASSVKVGDTAGYFRLKYQF